MGSLRRNWNRTIERLLFAYGEDRRFRRNVHRAGILAVLIGLFVWAGPGLKMGWDREPWSVLTALSTLALAFITFQVVLRDRKIRVIETTPNVVIQGGTLKPVELEEEDEGRVPSYKLKLKLFNLGNYPVFVTEGLIEQHYAGWQTIGVGMFEDGIEANSSKEITATIELNSLEKLRLRIFFLYGATNRDRWHMDVDASYPYENQLEFHTRHQSNPERFVFEDFRDDDLYIAYKF